MLAATADRLIVPNGNVNALQLGPSIEPEASILRTGRLLRVPRLLERYKGRAASLPIYVDSIRAELREHLFLLMNNLDMQALDEAYSLLEELCQKYVRDANAVLHSAVIPRWHHKLLFGWFTNQPDLHRIYPAVSSISREVTTNDLIDAQPALWAEVQLAVRCGPRLADALSSMVPYQSLLFPEGNKLRPSAYATYHVISLTPSSPVRHLAAPSPSPLFVVLGTLVAILFPPLISMCALDHAAL